MPTSSVNSDEMKITPLPASRELHHQPVDLLLAADVDPVRGLVEDEDVGAGVEPLRQHDLLLVAAGQVADGVLHVGDLDLQPLDRGPRVLALARRWGTGSGPRVRKRARLGSVMFFRTEKWTMLPWCRRSSGSSDDARAHRVARRPDGHLPAVHEHPPGRRAVGAEDQAGELACGRRRRARRSRGARRRGPRSSRPRRRSGTGEAFDPQQLLVAPVGEVRGAPALGRGLGSR